jgi:hypothetical protein
MMKQYKNSREHHSSIQLYPKKNMHHEVFYHLDRLYFYVDTYDESRNDNIEIMQKFVHKLKP